MLMKVGGAPSLLAMSADRQHSGQPLYSGKCFHMIKMDLVPLIFRHPSFGNIFDGKEDQFRAFPCDPSRVQEHEPAAGAGSLVIDLEVPELVVLPDDLLKQLPEPRHVPKTVLDIVDIFVLYLPESCLY